jgi:hypothetical protein
MSPSFARHIEATRDNQPLSEIHHSNHKLIQTSGDANLLSLVTSSDSLVEPNGSLPTPSSESGIMSLSFTNHGPTLTPITNESSPPDHHSRKRSYDQIDSPTHPSTLTPTLTPQPKPAPESKPSARPGPGEIKGHKILYDPQAKTKEDGKDRKHHKIKYIHFGDKVCAASIWVYKDFLIP